MNDLKKQLKMLANIMPDEQFVAASRRGILAVRQNVKPAWGLFSMWAAAAAMLVVSIVGFSSLLRTEHAATAVATPEALSREFNGLNINVELQSVSYQQGVDQTIASALSEISNNSMRHLNQGVLQSEQNTINQNSGNTSNPQIDTLLNKVIF